MDPREGPTILVAYLSGTGRRPVIRSYVLDKGEWGIGWDCKMDVGGAFENFHGMLKSSGSP